MKREAPDLAAAATTEASAPPANGFRATVRMYRQGLGDCFLVRLPRHDGSIYSILIDCGAVVGTPNAAAVMNQVAADVAATTGGKIDLLLATHAHWDHLSGFVQARPIFDRLTVGQVWLPWTEDPADPLAQTLAGEHAAALTALRLSANRLHLAGNDERALAIGTMLDFFGAASSGGASTADALEIVRGLTATPRYCAPGDPPVALGDPDARLYVLGPPRDEKLLRRTSPSAAHPETYGLALGAFRSNLLPSLDLQAPQAPFSTLYAIPNQVAEGMAFFARYWASEPWRQIDTAWLDDAAQLALDLDNATNNTSLVLAIELAGGDVLLFAADAQVGSWLSWQNVQWTVGDRTVRGPDLLKRTVLYKVGHHGSHNATLRQQGLDLMEGLRLAMIPVNQQVAQTKRWNDMPLQALVDALVEKTAGAVLRADADAPAAIPAAMKDRVVAQPLYFEVTL